MEKPCYYFNLLFSLRVSGCLSDHLQIAWHHFDSDLFTVEWEESISSSLAFANTDKFLSNNMNSISLRLFVITRSWQFYIHLSFFKISSVFQSGDVKLTKVMLSDLVIVHNEWRMEMLSGFSYCTIWNQIQSILDDPYIQLVWFNSQVFPEVLKISPLFSLKSCTTHQDVSFLSWLALVCSNCVPY